MCSYPTGVFGWYKRKRLKLTITVYVLTSFFLTCLKAGRIPNQFSSHETYSDSDSDSDHKLQTQLGQRKRKIFKKSLESFSFGKRIFKQRYHGTYLLGKYVDPLHLMKMFFPFRFGEIG